jgi:hypothetical protein
MDFSRFSCFSRHRCPSIHPSVGTLRSYLLIVVTNDIISRTGHITLIFADESYHFSHERGEGRILGIATAQTQVLSRQQITFVCLLFDPKHTPQGP